MALIRQRKLTKQQMRRINKQKDSSKIDDCYLLDGVVIAHYGKQLEVQVTSLPEVIPDAPVVAENEPEPFWQPLALGDIWRCHTRTNLPMLAAGDKVKWTADSNTGFGRIEILKERTSLISRPDRYHKLKPVSANTDILAIVFAPLPVPAASLIDRYLVVAKHAHVKPLLILNKSDLLLETDNHEAVDLLEDYKKLGYETLVTSAIDETNHANYDDLAQKLHEKISCSIVNICELSDTFKDKTLVFAGQSGVGKSSLINSLLPYSRQSVNVISENSKLGQHTTTTSRYLPFIPDDLMLEHGGIIDTPGIREYGIWHLTPDDILVGFTEFTKYLGHCKFRDCKHTANTKGCALREAVEQGEILERRVDSLVRLQEEADTKDYK